MLPFVFQGLERSVWVGRDDSESHFWPGAWGPQQQIGFRVTRLEVGLEPIYSYQYSLTMQPIPKIVCTRGPLGAPGPCTVLAFRPQSHLLVSIYFSSFFPAAICSSLSSGLSLCDTQSPVSHIPGHFPSPFLVEEIVTNDCCAWSTGEVRIIIPASYSSNHLLPVGN